MKVRKIRLGSLITLYNGIYAIIYGIILIFFKNLIMQEYFIKAQVSWNIFTDSFPYRADIYLALLTMKGFMLVCFGIFIIYLSYFILKRKDKLAWVVLFTSGILGWASLFIVNLITGSWILRGLSFIGWASFVLGMIIPLKYYLGKNYQTF
jgi:hypothetical protein